MVVEPLGTVTSAPSLVPPDDPAIPNHRFVAPDIDLRRLAGRLQNWFAAERMEAQVVESDGRVLVQARSASGFTRGIGAGVGFSIKMWTEGPELVLEMGQMKWADKAAAAAVGMLVFWPALIPAVVGGAKQKALPAKALRIIETAIPECTGVRS
jgi:hypothetical protein